MGQYTWIIVPFGLVLLYLLARLIYWQCYRLAHHHANQRRNELTFFSRLAVEQAYDNLLKDCTKRLQEAEEDLRVLLRSTSSASLSIGTDLMLRTPSEALTYAYVCETQEETVKKLRVELERIVAGAGDKNGIVKAELCRLLLLQERAERYESWLRFFRPLFLVHQRKAVA